MLLTSGGSRSQALELLRRAETLSQVRLLKAEVLADAGRRNGAARELEAFMRAPSPFLDQSFIEKWLADLKK